MNKILKSILGRVKSLCNVEANKETLNWDLKNFENIRPSNHPSEKIEPIIQAKSVKYNPDDDLITVELYDFSFSVNCSDISEYNDYFDPDICLSPTKDSIMIYDYGSLYNCPEPDIISIEELLHHAIKINRKHIETKLNDL